MTQTIAKNDGSPALSIQIWIMGQEYVVPAGLTIMKAMEFAGFRYIRGAGCRAGFCGACATVYRKQGDYHLRTALACQSLAEEGMVLAQLPFVPANKALYNVNDLDIGPENSPLLENYPCIARCVSCNTCTKACPQELEVMDFIQAALRGDIAETARLSFDCIQCGLCAIRCPAEIPHYHVAQLARRIRGLQVLPPPSLDKRCKEIAEGKYDKEYEELRTLPLEKLKERYTKRDLESKE